MDYSIRQIWDSAFRGAAPDGLLAFLDEESFSGHSFEGTTKILRNPDFQEPFVQKLVEEGKKKVLIVAGSIGLEACTLGILAKNAGYDELQVDTLDISPVFTQIAQGSCYGEAVLLNQGQDICRHFEKASQAGFVTLSGDIAKNIHVLDAQNVFSFKADKRYDAVICQNLIRHLDFDAAKALALRLAHMTQGYFCFDTPERIEEKERFRVVLDDIKGQLRGVGLSFLGGDWKPLSDQDFYPDGTRKEKSGLDETVMVFERNC
ncbi:MAG: CheR family methyltransferase [Alphaproteobacteria bacterium]